jgi:membrane-bound lytic murein transglycosylase MltF
MFRAVIALVLASQLIACASPREPLPAPHQPFGVSGIPSRIRVLVAPSRTHYRLDNGVARGASVDAADEFEQWLNAQATPRFDVALIETPQDRLIPDLLAGKGDIAANLLLTFERDDQVAFAKPIKTAVKEIVVTGPDQPPLVSLEDVGGRVIHVRKSSDHHASLLRLNEQLQKINRPPAKIVVASAATDEDLLELVNDGKIPATIADDYVFDAWRAKFPKLNANRDVAVSQDGIVAWVTRKDAPKLLAAMNQFFSSHKLTF